MRVTTAFIGLCFTGLALGQGGFSGPGRYEITNIKSGKVIDLDRNDQTSVIQFSSRGTDNQTWDVQEADSGFFYLRNGMNGNALTAFENRNAAPVEAVPFRGDPSQQWRIEPGKDGNVLIVSREGRALDIPDGTNRDGVRIRVFDRNGDSNQRFAFRMVGGRDLGRNGRFRNAQTGGPVITCASDDGGRHNCAMDTRNGVQLSRQISGSACVQGQTWDYDDRGVWVDRGCRAEFTAGGGPGYNTSGRSAGAGIVTCSSDDGGRRNCSMDTRNGVQLTRQISGSACIQGQSWDYDDRGVWVDRGCRAEFTAGGGQGYYNASGGSAGAAIVTCSSDDGRRHNCSADTRNGVLLSRQISGSACIEGQTWGFDNNGIWVDRGCRAEFSVGSDNRGRRRR